VNYRKYTTKLEDVKATISDLTERNNVHEGEINSLNDQIKGYNDKLKVFRVKSLEEYSDKLFNKLKAEAEKNNIKCELSKVKAHNNAQYIKLESSNNELIAEEQALEDKYKELYKECTIVIRKGDLVDQREDAIINPANEFLMHDGGAAKAIAEAGGKKFKKLSKEYIDKYTKLETGKAMTTDSGDLKCDKVIHVVGPIYKNKVRDQEERELLRQALMAMLEEMHENKCQSIAFPAISTGIFGYPLDKCASGIADVIKKAIDSDPAKYEGKKIVICNFDDKTTNAMLKYIPDQLQASSEIMADTEFVDDNSNNDDSPVSESK
jgi:O-acetyl-ADP-ribose deacetylase (regulator of RNase III)